MWVNKIQYPYEEYKRLGNRLSTRRKTFSGRNKHDLEPLGIPRSLRALFKEDEYPVQSSPSSCIHIPAPIKNLK